MSLRHKAFKATLDRGYASEWNDDHHFDPTDKLMFHTAFVENKQGNWWNTAQTTGATFPDVQMVDNHGFIVLDSTVDVGDIASIRKTLGNNANDVTHKNDLPILTMTAQLVSPAGVGLTHEFGLFCNGDVPFTANQCGAYFRIAANVLYAVTGTGVAETATNLGAPSEYGVYRIEFTSTLVNFYVDNLITPAAVHTNNIPTDNITIKYSTIGVAAGAQVLRSDFCGLTRLRKK